MSDSTATRVGWIPAASRSNGSGGGEMHDISALSGLVAKALAEEIGHVGLVIDDQDAAAHAAAP